MKKMIMSVIVLLVLSAGLSVFSSAVIQSPPKDTDITAYVYRTDAEPERDGVISSGEYKKLNIPQSSLSYVVGSEADWARAKKTEFEAYASVCSGRFNFALTVKLDREYYTTECEPKYMWAQTALLLSFAKSGTTGRNALELGVRPGGEYFIWNQYSDYSPENDFIAVYEDGVATYEISVPLSAFGAENDNDFKFCFSISVGDYFNGERQAYVQFGKGISGFSDESDADAGKDAALFPAVYILNEGEEPATAAPHTTDGTDTGVPDTGVDLKLAAVLSISCMAVSLSLIRLILHKKREN